jgi:enoyl-CoA hydratase
VVPGDELDAAAMELAGEIAAKDGELLRLAKAAINGIDPVDVRRSYRFEQGFTYEASVSGVGDRVRDGFDKGSGASAQGALNSGAASGTASRTASGAASGTASDGRVVTE